MTEAPKPSCTPLLDGKIRKQLRSYSTLGYVGFVISEAIAYITLLEEELAKAERTGADP